MTGPDKSNDKDSVSPHVAAKLSRSRQAILNHVARRQRHHDPREAPAYASASAATDDGYVPPPERTVVYEDAEPDAGAHWLGHVLHAVRTWWRYHPASMATDLAMPLVHSYARRKPAQLLGISFAVGALLVFARPWKLISLTTILVALLKSSQLSSLLTAALSAADYRKDGDRPH